MLPLSFQNCYTINKPIHSYPTSNPSDFHLVNPKLLIVHRSIRHHGPDLWNSLPESIKIMLLPTHLRPKLKRC